MLSELRISNLGVIESAELVFGSGLNVLTGETGAGKTMILNALNLVLGGKADTKLIRQGSNKLTVESDWKLSLRQKEKLSQLIDIDVAEIEDEITITRIIDSSGKSRLVLDGITRNLSIASDFADQLIQVFGQNDQRFLGKSSWQLGLIDKLGAAAHTNLLHEYQKLFKSILEMMQRKLILDDKVSKWGELRQKMINDLSEFDTVNPSLNEDTEIIDTIKLKEEKESSLEKYQQLSELLSSEDGQGILDQIERILQISNSLPGFSDLSDDLHSVSRVIGEIESRVFKQLSSELEGPSLSELYSRKAQLQNLIRKHQMQLDELIERMQFIRTEINNDENPSEALAQLVTEIDQAQEKLQLLAKHISKNRKEISKNLSAEVNRELEILNMGKTIFSVSLSALSSNAALTLNGNYYNELGQDSAVFQIALGSSAPARDVHKSASGGELSRIMLALQVVVQKNNIDLSYVFDEVDAGIGGETAIEVGKRLANLGSERQVLIVTHLPQVAVFADTHFVVAGNPASGISTSDVQLLDEKSRIQEIARMLGGMQTDASITHAKELLALK